MNEVAVHQGIFTFPDVIHENRMHVCSERGFHLRHICHCGIQSVSFEEELHDSLRYIHGSLLPSITREANPVTFASIISRILARWLGEEQ